MITTKMGVSHTQWLCSIYRIVPNIVHIDETCIHKYFSDVNVTVQCNHDDSFVVTIGDQKYNVTAKLEQDDDRLSIRCNINGVMMSSHVVIQNDAINIFTTVSEWVIVV